MTNATQTTYPICVYEKCGVCMYATGNFYRNLAQQFRSHSSRVGGMVDFDNFASVTVGVYSSVYLRKSSILEVVVLLFCDKARKVLKFASITVRISGR